jgi:hypothetical protein
MFRQLIVYDLLATLALTTPTVLFISWVLSPQ